MLRTTLATLIAAAVTMAVAPAVAAQEGEAKAATAMPGAKKSGRIPVNGVDYYCEVAGEGEPLLLLHGGLGSIDMFAPVLPMLTKGREVIAVDMQGHGRTTLGDRPISLIDIGDDLAVILKELGYGQVDVMGYSMGAGAAFRLAVQHPDLVRRLAIVSAPLAKDGFFPEMIPQQESVGAGMFEMMKQTPMYTSYIAVAPKPEDFPRLLDRMGEAMRQPYDWREDVKSLKMPVMLAYGDSDMIRPEHIVEVYQLLGGGLKDAGWMRENMSQNRLAIVPNLTHYEAFMAPEMTATVLPFLNGVTTGPSWGAPIEGK